MSYDKPLPKSDPLMAPFWAGARAGRLLVQTCRACNDAHSPPGPVCPACLSADQDWKETAAPPTLQSWVRFHRAYWDGFRDALPYPVCLVQLAEGPLLVSNLVGDIAGARLGAPLRAVFDPVTPEVSLPKFSLLGSPPA